MTGRHNYFGANMKQFKNLSKSKIIKFIILFIIILLFTWLIKDCLTPLLFGGRGFSGRSLIYKIILLFAYSIFTTFFFFLFSGFLTSDSEWTIKLHRFTSIFLNWKITLKSLWNLINQLCLKIADEFSIEKTKKRFTIKQYSWKSVLLINYVSVFLYVFFEWLFFISKPSFISTETLVSKLGILVVPSSISILGITAVIFVLFIFGQIGKIVKVTPKYLKAVAIILASIILTSLSIIMIDNFTYTVLNVGIVTSRASRIIYLFILLIILPLFFIFLNKQTRKISKKIKQYKFENGMIPIIIVLSCISLGLTIKITPEDISKTEYNQLEEMESYPNIVLVTADGLNALHMSAYGYEKNTTPHIQELITDCLLSENAFTNSGNTAGSLTSIFTGKYPTVTRVLFPPDILKGKDSYEHIISILDSLNYSTAQLSFPYYADSYDVNFRSGFDYANGRSYQEDSGLFYLTKRLESNQAFFIYSVVTRLTDRFGHIFFIKDMTNLQYLAQGHIQNIEDKNKVDTTIDLIENSDNPVFVHIHWMGTHGPEYYPDSDIFSGDKKLSRQRDYDQDLYDDSIVDFDNGVNRLIEELQSIGEYNNTILVIASDHGQAGYTDDKIPLIIHFPDDEYAGRVSENVQNIDISPTLLDYLGIEKPEWMSGKSLLSEEIGNRPIFSVATSTVTYTGNYWTLYYEPPFYQFSNFNLILNDQFFNLDIRQLSWYSSIVEGHVNDNSVSTSITEDQANDLLLKFLTENSFDISSIPDLDDLERPVEIIEE